MAGAGKQNGKWLDYVVAHREQNLSTLNYNRNYFSFINHTRKRVRVFITYAILNKS